ncbi:twin-arginine translocase subunit TatC [Zooshikella marina]|uniref:twin-arginine translocase subunit TatC n=1 Tax=Zooshikella ganghwensis TaxID=202772 RepID=UPI001BB0965B|nr:twin-arginine translocase subunit TatC [Zooshikella ganghwensis]MBU2708440.1 twin-arginine translocase subunit TatC [Zooshikella ganghwensis]
MRSTARHGEPLNAFSHLVELRQRFFYILLSVLLVFLGLLYFANDIYEFLSAPLITHLPDTSSMIATEVTSPLLTPIKLTFIVALFVCVPVILYQLWGFIAPGLYQNERQLIMPLLVSSSLMFYAGIAFAYFLVFPIIFEFLTHITLEGVKVATEISHYLDFAMTLFMAFGIAFEVPIAIILLCWLGVTTAQQLRACRPHVFVSAFVVSMLLTPPDIISQSLLAIPMYLLFEIGLFCSRYYTGDRH